MDDEFTRVTFGANEYMLVASHAVLQWSAAQAHESLLLALEDPASARELRELARSSGFTGDPSNDAAIVDFVASLIASGALVPLCKPEPLPALRPIFGPPRARADWSTTVPLSSLARVAPPPTWFEVRIVDRWGSIYEGARLELEAPDGRATATVLDDRSTLRIDEVPAGAHRVRALDVGVAASRPARETRPARGEGVKARAGAQLALPVATKNLVRLEVPHGFSW